MPLGCLRDSIPKLTRSSLHRCLERHGISRLPENPDKASKRGKFAQTAIGFVHVAAANPAGFRDISELRLAGGKLNMFLAIDRVSKFTYVEFRDDAGKMNGARVNTVHFAMRMAALKSMRVVGCGVRGRSG